MLPRLARALESLFGGGLASAAGFLRGAAQLVLVIAVAVPLVRAALTFTAFRRGWETALVVRCPRCRRLVADPESQTCPEGHPVRFPPAAAAKERWRRRFHRSRRVLASYGFVLPAFLALGSVVAFRVAGAARVEGPLAAICASTAFLFFASALALAGLALSPRPRGAADRLLHAGVAVLCLGPALVLALLARGFEPPRPRAIGHLWNTPTALYLSSGGRARRVGEAVGYVEAHLVDVRAPAFGIVWQGFTGLEAGPRFVRWRGRGGSLSRLLERWAAPLSRRGVFLARSRRGVPLPPNVRVWIVSEGGEVRFTPGGDHDLGVSR
ncbi:MAG TPA: hypothetical protein VFF17_03035 [Thermoanaerobaculia bacterium]|nr:hypothetical protein [Thermoanaerobaculia bacterium]